MDVNVLIVCITVIAGLIVACATVLACVEKTAEFRRARGESGERDE